MTLQIKIHPNAKNDRFVYQDGVLEIWIKAPATEGKANKYLIDFLSQILDIPKSLINISKGGQSKYKLVVIEVEEEVVLGKLQGNN
jgi:uncharacterized protein (TIGR00251 family)